MFILLQHGTFAGWAFAFFIRASFIILFNCSFSSELYNTISDINFNLHILQILSIFFGDL